MASIEHPHDGDIRYGILSLNWQLITFLGHAALPVPQSNMMQRSRSPNPAEIGSKAETGSSKQDLLNAANSALCGLIVVDQSGLITEANERVAEMLGYGQADLIGSPVSRLFARGQRAPRRSYKAVLERSGVTGHGPRFGLARSVRG